MRTVAVLAVLFCGCLGAQEPGGGGRGSGRADMGVADQGGQPDTDPGGDLAAADTGRPPNDAEAADSSVPPLPALRLNEISCRGEEWVELYNPGPSEAVLRGWTLSDDPARASHRLLIDARVPAEGFRVLGRDEPLPFGVSCGEDTLVLLDPHGALVDMVPSRDPGRDLTWGRWPDGEGEWASTEPTPGAANRLPAVGQVLINEVDCKGRDWVELYNDSDGAVPLGGWILGDSEDPGEGWTIPAGTSVAPHGLVVLRQQDVDEAGFSFGVGCGRDTIYLHRPDRSPADSVALAEHPEAFTWGRLPDGGEAWAATEPTPGEPNRAPADEAAQLFDPTVIHHVELRLGDEQMESLRRDPYLDVPGEFRLRQNDDSPWLQVEIRLKGRAGSLRSVDDKPSLKVDLNALVRGQRVLGLKKLTFNNMVQDPSMIHEWLSYSLFRGMGLHAPRIGYARVTLNELDYGVYAIVEAMDNDWLERHFASTEHLYEGLYGTDLFHDHVDRFEVDEGDASDTADLREVISLADAVEPALFYEQSGELVEWTQVVTFMGVELYTGHWDGYAATRNNYYFHLNDAGQLSLLPWGTDQTFDAELGIHEGQGRLLQLCMASPACRQTYDLALLELLELLDRSRLPDQVQTQADRVGAWAADDPRRPHGDDRRRAVVQRTIDFLRSRREQVGELLRCLTGPDADPDEDGFACDADCDNNDPTIHPGAVDTCGDGIDQDCNGWPDDGPDCPDCVERRLDGRRYLVCTSPRSWQEGQRECEEQGSQMAIVGSQRENDWLYRQARELRPNLYWIGLSDRASEGDFRWVDGSEPAFEAWNAGEPNNAGNNEDCAHFWDDRPTWNDIPCGERFGTLCEDPCVEQVDADGDGVTACDGDCDDGDETVFPGAPEVCDDGIDQDCSGEPDDWPCGAPGTPEQEPNNDAAACNAIPAGGGIMVGELAGDRDWFCIEAQAGQTLVFDIDAHNGRHRPPRTNLDAYLLLHQGGAVVAENDDADGLDSMIRYTSEAGGIYGIEVASCCVGDGRRGSFYSLVVGIE